MAQNASFPKTSGFPHVSAFQAGSPIGQITYAPDYKSAKQEKLDFDVVGVRPSEDQARGTVDKEAEAVTVYKTQIDDWIYRLKDAADEAGGSNLLALESDLLDLRDELDNLLH